MNANTHQIIHMIIKTNYIVWTSNTHVHAVKGNIQYSLLNGYISHLSPSPIKLIINARGDSKVHTQQSPTHCINPVNYQ